MGDKSNVDVLTSSKKIKKNCPLEPEPPQKRTAPKPWFQGSSPAPCGTKMFLFLRLAGIFGMNLIHGMESHPTAFLFTCGGITMAMTGVFAQVHI